MEKDKIVHQSIVRDEKGYSSITTYKNGNMIIEVSKFEVSKSAKA